MNLRPILTTAIIAPVIALAPALRAQEAPALSTGQTIYLPIYSHVYHGDPDRQGKPAQALTSTHVSIRNTDMTVPVRIHSARYYDTDGRLLKEYLPTPKLIPPLGTHELFVPYADTAGGSGANFILTWSAEGPANPPLMEALHADMRASRAMVFITTGRPIRNR